MKNATKFLQANNAALKDKQKLSAPEVKTFLQIVDSNNSHINRLIFFRIMKSANKILQANNAVVKTKQESSASEPKTFIQTVDSGKVLEIDKTIVQDLLHNQKAKDKLLRSIQATSSDPMEREKITKEKKIVKNLFKSLKIMLETTWSW